MVERERLEQQQTDPKTWDELDDGVRGPAEAGGFNA
jgi:hypothetical protein